MATPVEDVQPISRRTARRIHISIRWALALAVLFLPTAACGNRDDGSRTLESGAGSASSGTAPLDDTTSTVPSTTSLDPPESYVGTTVPADAPSLASPLPEGYRPTTAIEQSPQREPGVQHISQRLVNPTDGTQLTVAVVAGRPIESWVVDPAGETVASPTSALSAVGTTIYQVELSLFEDQFELNWALDANSFAALVTTGIPVERAVEIARSINITPPENLS